MIHAVFDRPSQHIKCFDSDGEMRRTLRGEGDAWGQDAANKYGHNAWMPPGHYLLGAPQYFDTPIVSEGFGQIPISDIDSATLAQLVGSHHAESNGSTAVIGGITAPLGQLAKYGRSALFVHGGGSNAPQPLADFQMLCKTEGCTRVWNAEWKVFGGWIDQYRAGNLVVYTVVGDPVLLAC